VRGSIEGIRVSECVNESNCERALRHKSGGGCVDRSKVSEYQNA